VLGLMNRSPIPGELRVSLACQVLGVASPAGRLALVAVGCRGVRAGQAWPLIEEQVRTARLGSGAPTPAKGGPPRRVGIGAWPQSPRLQLANAGDGAGGCPSRSGRRRSRFSVAGVVLGAISLSRCQECARGAHLAPRIRTGTEKIATFAGGRAQLISRPDDGHYHRQRRRPKDGQ
jgi:hypothetical protein